MEEKLSSVKFFDDRITEFIDNEEEMFQEIDTTGEFSRYNNAILFELSEFLRQKEPVLTPDVKYIAPNPVSDVSQNFAKLPKLELEKFDGNPLNFHSFWDSFSSVVNKNDSLDQVTKFNYLKSLLTD